MLLIICHRRCPLLLRQCPTYRTVNQRNYYWLVFTLTTASSAYCCVQIHPCSLCCCTWRFCIVCDTFFCTTVALCAAILVKMLDSICQLTLLGYLLLDKVHRIASSLSNLQLQVISLCVCCCRCFSLKYGFLLLLLLRFSCNSIA